NQCRELYVSVSSVIYACALLDDLPIYRLMSATDAPGRRRAGGVVTDAPPRVDTAPAVSRRRRALRPYLLAVPAVLLCVGILYPLDRKSTRLNSSHVKNSYAYL